MHYAGGVYTLVLVLPGGLIPYPSHVAHRQIIAIGNFLYLKYKYLNRSGLRLEFDDIEHVPGGGGYLWWYHVPTSRDGGGGGGTVLSHAWYTSQDTRPVPTPGFTPDDPDWLWADLSWPWADRGCPWADPG